MAPREKKTKFANGVNELVVRFIRLDYHEDLNASMLIMEHLSGIDFQHFGTKIRAQWMDEFESSLSQLHEAGFVFRGWGQTYDSILVTKLGLRLIDVGPSVLRQNVGDAIFEKYLKKEQEEIARFRGYFLN